MRLPKSSLFYRDLKSAPRWAEFTQGEGVMSNDVSFDDLSAGAGITCLGHSNEVIKEAMVEQIELMPYIHAMNWSSKPAEQLAEMLIERTTKGNTQSKFVGGRVIFLNSGAEAVEAACKLAMQCAYERGKYTQFYARRYSYHGNTLFTLGLGDHPKKRLYPYIEQLGLRVARFPAYRPSMSDDLSLDWLANTIGSYAFQEQPIVVIEPIGGTTLGIEPSTSEYLTALSDIVKHAAGILIYDEVLCGNYRTGELFAYQYYKAPEPDIICLGKGLTGGYFPLSAIIVSRRLVETIEEGSAKLWHSTTNQNHPIGCAAGIAALNEYELIKTQLPEFGRRVQEMAVDELSKVGVEICGVGSLLGVRLDPNKNGLHAMVRAACLDHGVVVYTDGQTIEGKGNMILLAPPYSCMNDLHYLECCLHNLALAIEEVVKEPA